MYPQVLFAVNCCIVKLFLFGLSVLQKVTFFLLADIFVVASATDGKKRCPHHILQSNSTVIQ